MDVQRLKEVLAPAFGVSAADFASHDDVLAAVEQLADAEVHRQSELQALKRELIEASHGRPSCPGGLVWP